MQIELTPWQLAQLCLLLAQLAKKEQNPLRREELRAIAAPLVAVMQANITVE